jgi:hypothetical protein
MVRGHTTVSTAHQPSISAHPTQFSRQVPASHLGMIPPPQGRPPLRYGHLRMPTDHRLLYQTHAYAASCAKHHEGRHQRPDG